MILMTVPEHMAGIRLDKFLKDHFPHLPHGIIHKTLRKKDIRLNGQRISENVTLSAGDELALFIPSVYLAEPAEKSYDPLDILHEDEHLLIVHKPAGLSVHPDKKTKEDTLIQLAAKYLQKKGTVFSDSSLPALCHRLDHHTRGLVILAKTSAARNCILQLIKEHRIQKMYLCLVKGSLQPCQGQITHYFEKNARLGQVRVWDQPQKHTLTAISRYRTLRTGEKVSLLEVELLTGRTHQIRAQLAHLGHPVLGDDKYGDRSMNRMYKVKTQQLVAHRIEFDHSIPEPFSYLSGLSLTLDPLPFIDLDLEKIPLAP